jgi:hypothetical protein
MLLLPPLQLRMTMLLVPLSGRSPLLLSRCSPRHLALFFTRCFPQAPPCPHQEGASLSGVGRSSVCPSQRAGSFVFIEVLSSSCFYRGPIPVPFLFLSRSYPRPMSCFYRGPILRPILVFIEVLSSSRSCFYRWSWVHFPQTVPIVDVECSAVMWHH